MKIYLNFQRTGNVLEARLVFKKLEIPAYITIETTASCLVIPMFIEMGSKCKIVSNTFVFFTVIKL